MNLETEKLPTEESTQPLAYLPKTALGERLLAIRERIIATGEALLNRDGVEKEIAARRGEYRD